MSAAGWDRALMQVTGLIFMRLRVKWSERGTRIVILTGIKIAFLGGDARMVEVIRYLEDWDASIVLFGFDHFSPKGADVRKLEFTESHLAEADVVIFPVAGMNDNGEVDAHYADAPLVLSDEHFASLKKSALIFTGIAREYFSSVVRKYGLSMLQLMELDEVAIANSIPTAEGAMALAMEHTEITIHGSRSVVLGLGRCGLTLARMLAGIGAKVCVCAREPGNLARAEEMGFRAYPMTQLEYALADADIIFNTIPAKVLTADVLTQISRQTVIIDIASAPGGVDYRYAEKHGIKAILAPSLPGVVAPVTAGRILAQSIVRSIGEQLVRGGA